MLKPLTFGLTYIGTEKIQLRNVAPPSEKNPQGCVDGDQYTFLLSEGEKSHLKTLLDGTVSPTVNAYTTHVFAHPIQREGTVHIQTSVVNGKDQLWLLPKVRKYLLELIQGSSDTPDNLKEELHALLDPQNTLKTNSPDCPGGSWAVIG